MVNGYSNRGLDVDLTKGTLQTFSIPDEVLMRTLGGRGIGVHYFFREVPARIDPLSLENVLVFAPGGLTGSLAPTSGRFSVTFKSPLTGTIASANSGGFWGVSLKRSGFDVLIIRGRAAEPVLIRIGGGEPQIVPCRQLWGKSIPELFDQLSGQISKNARIIGIGPAGENGVLFSALINDRNRAAGRAGVGAVMGAKNLKAIVVEGRKQFPPADPDAYSAGVTQARKLIQAMPVTSQALTRLGTAGLVKLIHDHDMLPHRNFQDVSHRHEDVAAVSGEALRKNLLVRSRSCFNCPVSCGRETRVGDWSGEGPEYETVALLGPNLDIYDIREIAVTNYLCNELGMDTISFGNTVGLAMELHEKGIWHSPEPIRFGTHGLIERLARLTAKREGVGNDLALGAKRLAAQHGVPELAMAVKGLEFPGYEPRATMAQALGYATSPRGGCHLQGGYAITLGFFGGAREVDRFLIETTAGHVVSQQDSGCISDSLGICRFASFAFQETELARIYRGMTGRDIGPHDLETAARLTQDRERRFNLAAGFTTVDDTLPQRMFNEKIMIAGVVRAIDRDAHFYPLLQKYYRIRGWDEVGIPRSGEE